jgi:cytochrome b involved in lipid metabolism
VKRLAFAAFVAFWAFVGAVLALDWLAPDTVPAAADATTRPISIAELARHGDAQSCWMAIEGMVYDVTSYLGRHPTPDTVLLAWCGRDASVGMRTKGYGRDHSPAAWARLQALQVGVLE